MDILNYQGKSQILVDFYIKFPHFNYQQFIHDNKLYFNNEEECIKYILHNENDYNLQEKVFLQKQNLIHYFNIFVGICINYGFSELINFNKYHVYNLKNEDLQNYNDKFTYLLVDARNLKYSINNEYKNKIILYLNADINDKHMSLIEKYSIKNFIVKNLVLKHSLLTMITDYKVIAEENDFDKCFYEIYNYKKKYEIIPEKINENSLNTRHQIEFEDVCDVDIEISVKSEQSTLKLMINGSEYSENIVPNELNKIHIYLQNINKIDVKYLSQVSFITLKYRKENEKIEQLYLSTNLYKYREDNRIHKCHNLKEYYDLNKPAFFYGFARLEDINMIMNHKGKNILYLVEEILIYYTI